MPGPRQEGDKVWFWLFFWSHLSPHGSGSLGSCSWERSGENPCPHPIKCPFEGSLGQVQPPHPALSLSSPSPSPRPSGIYFCPGNPGRVFGMLRFLFNPSWLLPCPAPPARRERASLRAKWEYFQLWACCEGKNHEYSMELRGRSLSDSAFGESLRNSSGVLNNSKRRSIT